ncbi:ABC transporter substrate-binding protein [Paenibacillus sp. J2TS4]|uniref:ABC transporter substrate-binding protein n=1 Tax=Paenibacillus sp. J2TS4 TaxID=2807194 RepID=UPI001B2DCD84|nr:ABC transporter substrate-binding protein [Paenibacillus sp. J2TS4]GIP35385.1 sugar ABC transporter substrate-binding protein [Paenibacillus sp. J2TS4]
MKMSIQRTAGSLLSVLAIAGALAACSSQQAEKPGDPAPGKSEGQTTTITFWHGTTDTEKDGLDKIMKAFNEQNPDIKVEATYIAQQGQGQNEKLLAAIAGGNPPDVAFFDRFEIGSWAARGSLTDLTDRANADNIDSFDYYPFAKDEATYKDRLYGLPMDTDSRLLFYNKDQFKEVGLDPENPPKTIKELEEAAEKLTKKEGRRFERIGFIPWYDQGWIYTWGWSFGGDFYDKNSGKVTAEDPQVVESLQWMVDFAKKYNIEDVAAFTDSAGSAAENPFLTGQLSMTVSGPWRTSGIKLYKPDLNYGVAPIPTPTGDNFTTWAGGWSFIIPKGAKNEDAAWEFIKFAAGKEGQKIYSETTGNLASIKSVNDELHKDDPIMKPFKDILPNAHHRPVISAGSLLWNELARARDMAIHEKGTPQELLEAVSKKVNDEINK